jgi:hypothetical protein
MMKKKIKYSVYFFQKQKKVHSLAGAAVHQQQNLRICGNY